MKKSLFFMCRPVRHRHRHGGKWYIRFYSRHPYPWFQASVRLDDPSQVFEHFQRFIDSAKEHMKISHINCDCCYQPRIR